MTRQRWGGLSRGVRPTAVASSGRLVLADILDLLLGLPGVALLALCAALDGQTFVADGASRDLLGGARDLLGLGLGLLVGSQVRSHSLGLDIMCCQLVWPRINSANMSGGEFPGWITTASDDQYGQGNSASGHGAIKYPCLYKTNASFMRLRE